MWPKCGSMNPDLFARLIREGDLGFCDAYLDGWWSTPDLQAFMDLIHARRTTMVYDGYPGMGLLRAYERLRFWLQSNSKTAGEEEHLATTTIWAMISTGCGWTRR